MLTTSSVFLKTLRDAGITHAFVNWGSDHPALLEDIQRQRVESGHITPIIITCPNEMVALTAAHGYALVLGKPAAVFVHVDVGTQALAGAVHNADRGRVPVLIYAGAAPFSTDGDIKGSRNEFIFWLQDIPDQPAIVRQYMRFTSQISSVKNVDKVVLRALQLATSDPQGPAYIWGRRENMEEEIDQATFDKLSIDLPKWAPMQPVTIPPSAVTAMTNALISSKRPLIVTSYLGRDLTAVSHLITLSDMLAVPVFSSCPTAVNFPHDHPNFVGCSFGNGDNLFVREADVILVLDSDVPWIPQLNPPNPMARIFHIDVDVLKPGMGMFHIDTEGSWRANAGIALQSIIHEASRLESTWDLKRISRRKETNIKHHNAFVNSLETLENGFSADGSFTVSNLVGLLRETVPQKTLFLNESITNYPTVWSHLQPKTVGSALTSGASSLGWGLGAAIGAHIALQIQNATQPNGEDVLSDLVCLITGDGSFMFGVPSSAFWIARRYDTPFLTIILNNGGWKAPKFSMLGVYPQGHGALASREELNMSFLPHAPDYSGIATAAGGAWGRKVDKWSDFRDALNAAIMVVTKERRCAVLDCCIESS